MGSNRSLRKHRAKSKVKKGGTNKRKNDQEHEVCQWCNMMIVDENFSLHQKFCPERPVKHRVCGTTLPLSQLDLHKTTCTPSVIPKHSERKRLAFLVGVNRYEKSPLFCAENDVTALAMSLRDLGFTTYTLKSPSNQEYQTAKRNFLSSINSKTIAVFHFSGHGGASFDHNAKINKNYIYLNDKQAIDARKMAMEICEARPLFSFVSIDACRNGEKDLLQMDIPNTLTILATAPGKSAYEIGYNLSVYTECLDEKIRRHGFQLDVRNLAGHIQRCLESKPIPLFATVVSNINAINDTDAERDARFGDPENIY